MEGGAVKFWSCREVSRMMASGEFDEGSLPRRVLARFHLLGCSYCRKFLRQMRFLHGVARTWSMQLLAPDEKKVFEDRLLKSLLP
jgi:hypothetical protein